MSRAQNGKAKHGGRNGARSKRARQQKHASVEDEMRDIEARCQALASSKTTAKRFDELPITSKTSAGLRRAAFVDMTEIQAKSIPLALVGRDVLGAAQTGSGKTLAFVIPVLERLVRERWGASDGLGALILSPTRELAIQIFEVLRKVGAMHSFSAGLIIGGKDVKMEKDRLTRMNILVATPGRLLQHMDQTVGFDASNVQILVLDEADRCLDMGFANTLDAILENVPKSNRQTLLFSATQTKRVKDLARLSLESPEYVAVHDNSGGHGALPPALQQHYMVIPLPQKLSVLHSFIRTHLKSKVLVFFSSCRQVQFVHESFRRLRPGIPLMCLHGKQKQTKRLDIFNAFTRSQHAVLFATDVAARGLDFPKVDWVIQVDTPEDADTYIHRVGRTARYNSKGNSLIFVLPSEEKGLLKALKVKDIAPDIIKPKESKVASIQEQLQGFLFQDPELKTLAQKAFVSYVRSIYLQRDKATFDVTQLPIEEFADSLGLANAPKVKFVKEAQAAKKRAEKLLKKERFNANGEQASESIRSLADVSAASDEASSDEESSNKGETFGSKGAPGQEDSEESDAEGSADDEDGPRYRQGQTVQASDDSDEGEASEDELGTSPKSLTRLTRMREESDDDFLTLKRLDHNLDDSAQNTGEGFLSKRKLQLGASKKQAAAAGMRGQGDKIVFDDDGHPRSALDAHNDDQYRGSEGGDYARKAASEFLDRERALLQERDAEDKARARQIRQERKQRRRERKRQREGQGSESDNTNTASAVFVAPEDDRSDGYETPDFDLGDESDNESGMNAADERPPKRAKYDAHNLAADETLALQLLGS